MPEGEKIREYKKENIVLAKNLRKNMTRHERKLWYEFLREYKPRFQRQKAIGKYIADFYCAKANMVIELDGGGHYLPEQIMQDNKRTEELQSFGIEVLRICNTEIENNFYGVCEYIDKHIKKNLKD